MLHLLEGRPEDRQPEHPGEGTHGLRVIGSQQPRRGRMNERVALQLEYAVCREEAQYAVESVGLGAHGLRETGGVSGRLVQRVRDAEVGDHVKASR
jgi:hypothetical protein